MSLWERFLRTTYKAAASPFLKRFQKKSIERVLLKSTAIIDSGTLSEIKNRITNSITKDGAFPDRGGKSDIYYTLFGCFVAEALSMNEILPSLKSYVKKAVTAESTSGINLFCGAILYSKLYGLNGITERLTKEVKAEVEAKAKVEERQAKNLGYDNFMGLLALYYLQDYRSILKLKKRMKSLGGQSDIPCSIAAAEAVINTIMGKSIKNSEGKLKSFYRHNGGFVALQNAPITDLLSTAVALYGLQFISSDLKDIKPDCLTFVDGLYLNGGFRATEMDFDIDIEYTFYGLLALGALID
jgi:hypothetical protein